MLIILMMMAYAGKWNFVWNIIVGVCAIYDFILIILEFYRHRESKKN